MKCREVASIEESISWDNIFDEQVEGLLVKSFTKADSEWLRFIIANRNCKTSTHEYDIVIGPTADAETTAITNQYYDELVQNDF